MPYHKPGLARPIECKIFSEIFNSNIEFFNIGFEKYIIDFINFIDVPIKYFSKLEVTCKKLYANSIWWKVGKK